MLVLLKISNYPPLFGSGSVKIHVAPRQLVFSSYGRVNQKINYFIKNRIRSLPQKGLKITLGKAGKALCRPCPPPPPHNTLDTPTLTIPQPNIQHKPDF